MSKKKIIIKVTNDNIWFNKTESIDIEFTDIPNSDLKFSYHREIFWEIELINFDKKDKRLGVSILNYNCVDTKRFYNQTPKDKIEFINFGKFNWQKLEPLLSSYQTSLFADKLTNFKKNILENTKQKDITAKQQSVPYHDLLKLNVDSEVIIPKMIPEVERQIEKVKELSFKLNDCKIMLGYISFTKHIDFLKQVLEIKIYNENLLPEFDNIKYWFSKKLKSKRIKVKITFNVLGSTLISYQALSAEIDKIDQEFIEGVKVQRTLSITKQIRPTEIDQALFTSENFYQLDDTSDQEGNVFKQSENDILKLIIEFGNVRNKKELVYLSGKKQTLDYRIRFTNHPNFGFIFLVKGETNNHFIWELLNTHATYIWTVENDLYNSVTKQYDRIEQTINTILDCGRREYKRAYKKSKQDDDLIFNVIFHKNADSKLIDEFPRWKHRINALIT